MSKRRNKKTTRDELVARTIVFIGFAIAFLAAVVCTVAELCAKNGLDTVICPVSAMIVIIPMVILF